MWDSWRQIIQKSFQSAAAANLRQVYNYVLMLLTYYLHFTLYEISCIERCDHRLEEFSWVKYLIHLQSDFFITY